MTFKKHDRVMFTGCKKTISGYVQGKIRQLYIIIDDRGKEWLMYENELTIAHTYSYKHG